MLQVVKHGKCDPENMEVVLEVLRKSDIGLNLASLAYLLRKDT
jgi:hypothetical protein